MARQFQPPEFLTRQPTKEEVIAGALGATAQTIPALFAKYKTDRKKQELEDLELQLKKRELEAKFGTGAPSPMIPGTITPTVPQVGPEEQIFGVEATPPTLAEETPEDRIARMGTEVYGAETARIKAQHERPSKQQLRVTDRNVPVLFSPQDGALTVQETGEPYDPAMHGALIVPGASPMLPAQQNVDITEITAARKQLRDLVSGAASLGFGKGNPYVEKARASRFNPFQLMDPDAQKFKQLVASTKQIIGKGLEGGVLRREDEYKYEAIIPRAGDTEDILETKAKQLDDLLLQRQEERVQGLSGAGFRGVPSASSNLPPIQTGETGQSESGGLPSVGQPFQGGKVLRVRRIE